MDFNVHVYGVFNFLGMDFRLTETLRNFWIIGGVLILFAIITRIKLNKFTDVPTTKFQSFVEAVVEAFDNYVVTIMGKENREFGQWYFGVFVIVLLSNLSGLLTLRPPTADLVLTLCFGISTFVLIHFMGITRKKKEYWKGYLEPMPLFLPMNIIGELALPVSLSFRLFGNILGGMIIMALYYELVPIFFKIGIPAIFHIYFDIFAGCLQAYIIVTLSMTFLRQQIPDEA